MNPLQLAAILASTFAFVSASLLDNRNEYKIQLLNDDQLTDVFKNLNDHNRSQEFRPKYNEVVALFQAKMKSANEALNNETKGLQELSEKSPFNTVYFNELSATCGTKVVETAKREWVLRRAALDAINDSNLSKHNLPGSIAMLQADRDAVINALRRNCPNQSITDCYARNPSQLDRAIDPVKKWAYAQEIYGGAPVFGSGEWVKSEWKPLLGSLNTPESRFAVAPIGEDLNLVSGWKSNGENLTAAIATLRSNFASLKAGIPAHESAALRADVNFREKVMNVILATSEEVPLVDFAVIGRRVKAFERIVEGIVRAHQSGISLRAEEATKAVKAWLMSVQMFTQRGFEDAKVTQFATLAAPNGPSHPAIAAAEAATSVVTEPATATQSIAAGDKRPRSNSESTATATAPESSAIGQAPKPKKHFFGIF